VHSVPHLSLPACPSQENASGLHNHVDGFDLVIGNTVSINTLPTLNLPAGYAGNLEFADTGGILGAGEESLRLVFIPEPNTIALLGIGAALLALAQRRRAA